MSQPDTTVTADQHHEVTLAAAQAEWDQEWRAYKSIVERITPWLFDVGSWIFGGLIAFTVVILEAIIPIRPLDLPIEIALTALALALPLHVTGLVLLRLVRDVKSGGFEQGITKAFQDAGLTPGERQIPSLTALETLRKHGISNVLNTTLGILTASSILTVAGVVATLWHEAWWIAVTFVAVVVLCQVLVQIVLFTAQPRLTKAQRAQRRRENAEIVRQAKEQVREQLLEQKREQKREQAEQQAEQQARVLAEEQARKQAKIEAKQARKRR